jgi:hypothetical protein
MYVSIWFFSHITVYKMISTSKLVYIHTDLQRQHTLTGPLSPLHEGCAHLSRWLTGLLHCPAEGYSLCCIKGQDADANRTCNKATCITHGMSTFHLVGAVVCVSHQTSSETDDRFHRTGAGTTVQGPPPASVPACDNPRTHISAMFGQITLSKTHRPLCWTSFSIIARCVEVMG